MKNIIDPLIFLLLLGGSRGILVYPKEAAALHNSSYPDIKLNTRYVELYFVADQSLYTRLGNETVVMEKFQEIVNALDTIYNQLNVRMSLSGVEIWKGGNKINITSSISPVLSDFQSYAKNSGKGADSIHLLTAQFFAGAVAGQAYLGSMCWEGHSGSVCNFNPSRHISDIITTLAHEIGHTLTMTHDDQSNIPCQCDDPSGVCFMHSTKNIPPQVMFSRCSIDLLNTFLNSELANCLVAKPKSKPVVSVKCGNNEVDDGEECDCGSPEYCVNACCDPNTCKLRAGAECFVGPCCQNCKLASSETRCRSTANECDVADFCDGINSNCENLVVQNGHSCSDNGTCFDGRCRSHNLQCKYMWGAGASVADNMCYTSINTIGEKFGHCGIINETAKSYMACPKQNSFCGKLFCQNINSFPIIGFTASRSKMGVTKADGTILDCVLATVDFGIDQPEPGMVWDGTPCGSNKYCLGHKCIDKDFDQKCNVPCKEHQVCTNKGVCRCAWPSNEANCVPTTSTDNPSVETTIRPSADSSLQPSGTTHANATSKTNSAIQIKMSLLCMLLICTFLVILI